MNIDEVFNKLMSSSVETRDEGRKMLRELAEAGVGEADALTLLRFATEKALPAEKFDWIDSRTDAVSVLWRSAHTSLLAPVTNAYANVDDKLRVSLLALVGAIGSREAAVALVDLVQRYGWPKRIYPRVWQELGRLAREHATILFPSLLEVAGEHFLDVGSVALGALATGKLSSAALGGLVPIVGKRLTATLDEIEPLQQNAGIAWRFADEYAPLRSDAGFLCDLAGWLSDTSFEAELLRATRLSDPWPTLFATIALLRLGRAVDDASIARVASSNETRAIMFSQMDQLGRLSRFPIAQASLDAMAAADMVNWLKFPTELGREPDQLEKMATFDSDEGLRLYVWRFTGHAGEWAAAVSGPYEIDAPPGPVSGESTFSRFEAWESATAEEHAARAVETLQEWRESWRR
jgi:hypothetical protein